MSVQRALVVDDSRSARKVLERMLQKAGLEVEIAEDAEQAIEQLQVRQPDVIFMDHMMPGMNGLEATKAIKDIPALAHIPTIMYTSKDDSDYLAQAKEHGACAVLPKPASSDALAKALSEAQTALDLAKPATSAEESASESTAESLTEMAEITATQEESSAIDVQASLEPQAAAEPTISQEQIEGWIRKQIQENNLGIKADFAASIDTAVQQLTQTQENALSQFENSQQEELEKRLGEADQSSTDETELFKAMQPLIQKLALQVSTHVIKQKLTPLEEALEKEKNKQADIVKKLDEAKKAADAAQASVSSTKKLALLGMTLSVIALVLAGMGL